jgi:hypothetical protein
MSANCGVNTIEGHNLWRAVSDSNDSSLFKVSFITGQNEREETTQDAIVTKSAAFASYEINYLTYITAICPRLRLRLRLNFGIRGLRVRTVLFHICRETEKTRRLENRTCYRPCPELSSMPEVRSFAWMFKPSKPFRTSTDDFR